MFHVRRVPIDPQGARALSHVLGVRGIYSNPDTVDMSTVNLTMDMSMGGFCKLNDYSQYRSCLELTHSVAGVQTRTFRILRYGSPNPGEPEDQILVPLDHNFYSWGIKSHLILTAAGAAAMAGKYISIEILMQTPAGDEITKYHGTGHVSAGVELYAPGHYEFPPLNRDSLYVVPAGCTLTEVWWVQDGTNFPAGSTVTYSLAGCCLPLSSPIPMGV